MLNLSGNALSSLPDDLHRLTRMRILFCSDNHFTEVPECVGQCAALTMIGFKANRIRHVSGAALPPLLRWLILTDNCIDTLPSELGERPYLQKLLLAGNRLQALPTSMSQCHRLELIRIAANQLRELPQWLLTLPSLTWLAYAGNPLETEADAAALEATPLIDWSTLRLQQRLGEGASGVISRAQWQRSADSSVPVAVKLYKGEMTSDGSPLHEMNACITAGLHPNLIRVEGRVHGHPDGQHGLVMQLIDPSFRNLAALPSLASCSRDVYAEDCRFSAEVALNIAKGIASAAEHLHQQGITHGDLYGHNILLNDQGDCLLGILARHRSMPPRTIWKPGRCNASKCGRSGFCWGIAGAHRLRAECRAARGAASAGTALLSAGCADAAGVWRSDRGAGKAVTDTNPVARELAPAGRQSRPKTTTAAQPSGSKLPRHSLSL